MKRRDFFKLIGVGTGIFFAPSILKAGTTPPRVVIVGGGYSGRSAAKYLKKWGGSSIDVTLIDKDSIYTSPILSNLVLNNQKTISQLQFDYSAITSNYGVKYINGEVSSIDKDNKKVILKDGSIFEYDKLILATGIDFIKSNDYDFNIVPHAWIAGEQTTLLKSKIDSLQSGDRFILTIPKSPYRCPPGPYERACVVADYLKNIRGVDVEIVVLDENSDFVVEKDSFEPAFSRYGIKYYPNSKVINVDDSNMVLKYEESGVLKELSARVINVIPNQKAPALLIDSGLCDETNFAPVKLINYESLIVKDIHIIGDSHKSTQPKAGHIANVEAKVCADAILRELNGYELYPKPKTNSACYSPLSSSTATWLTAVYEYDAATNSMITISKDAGSESSSNYEEMFNWSGNLFSDTFS
ncbi:MAG: NAD(P)/FAD-dependent oxidoreductase [Epsilonproteobacteria bacterium]|nr:NAD(P)/FAD-dependent oxidoreductase [Campylobacterota bacterium]